jgi:hypothetical protein
VHVVDPFDFSGDAFSVPVYRRIGASIPEGMRERFERNVARVGLTPWVELHQGRAVDVAATWTKTIDMLVLSADFSVTGARAVYDAWERFLRPGGLLALQNSNYKGYAPGHDGNHRVLVEELCPPRFSEPWFAGDYGFAICLVDRGDQR